MSRPARLPSQSSDGSTSEDPGKIVNLWFAVAVIGSFVFTCFYTLKVAGDLFLPIVLAGFLSAKLSSLGEFPILFTKRFDCFPLLTRYDPYEDLSVARVIQGILDEAMA